ncbi:MAG: tetratricopeptide repeat protein [Anaerolineales bacterium]|nr:tetratricopeptide repeat protein [Anaerolineales bacterium]
MYASLLATKLRIPDHPARLAPRPRLTQLLEQAARRQRLTVVSAPAGYGKTTLLADWAHTTHNPVAWLSLSDTDDERDRLLRSLLAAWERIQPEVAGEPPGVLLSAQGPNPEAVLSAFLNSAAQLPAGLVFVLDDYHVIQDPAVHEALAFLLDNAPPRLHFALGTRVEPPLPLARYRARGQALELGAEDLRFSPDEAARFLSQALGGALPTQAAQRWLDQLEGWAAGLQLAALSLRQRGGASPGAARPSGQQRYIADYLSQDVLDRLPAEVQDFLLRTSILESLSASLCEAVTAAAGGQAMLERLERQNLFVQALDDERIWFRYHPVFAGFLRGELNRRHAAEVAELHRRAAAWYLRHDLPEPALDHAVAGESAELAVDIIDRHFNVKLNGGEFKVVRRWIDALPAAWYAAYPTLGLMQAGLLAFSGDVEGCLRQIDVVEQQVAAKGAAAGWPMARVMAVRCFIACATNDVPAAESYAGRALRDLPADDTSSRPGVYGALGDAYRRNGRWAEARECYLKALGVTHSPTVRLYAPTIFGALADLELMQGRLQAASGYWRKALAAVRDPENFGRLDLPLIGWVYIRMGELLYEWNQLAEAWDHLSRGLQHAELGGDVRALIAGRVCASRLRLAEGDIASAGAYLEQARPLVEKAHFPYWAARFDRLQLEFWLAQNRLRAAVDWSDRQLEAGAFEGQPVNETAELAVVRALIVKSDTPALQRALALVERLLAVVEAEGRAGMAIEALALQALARQARGERAQALVLLERTLRLAEPEGYVRLFADLGLPMGRLLQSARSRDVRPNYVATLLAAFGPEAAALAGPSRLPEPLTARERDVLRLLAAGLTNREIAGRLVISPETVKKHRANLYGKLGASNRTQVVARARELSLLG